MSIFIGGVGEMFISRRIKDQIIKKNVFNIVVRIRTKTKFVRNLNSF